MLLTVLHTCSQTVTVRGVDFPRGDVEALLTARIAAPHSPALAQMLVSTLAEMCLKNDVNRVTCVDAGAIPAVLAAMSAHGSGSAVVAEKGCDALGMFAYNNTANVDTMMSAGGLEVMVSVMESHARVQQVQRAACEALKWIAQFASPAVVARMRGSRVVELINTAKANHPIGGEWTVTFHADAALSNLSSKARKYN